MLLSANNGLAANSGPRRVALRVCAVVAAALLTALAGCASPVTTADSDDFQQRFDNGDFKGAATTAMAAGQVTDDGQTKNIVWSLNAGSALFHAGDMKRSVAVLDTTEKLAQANDLDHVHAAIDYRYTTYDGVMTNLYKAMAFIAQHDMDDARVEFNRAEDRQRRAEEKFAADIAASQAKQASDANFSSLVGKAEANTDYVSANAKLRDLAVYKPFENPFATYMAGIFFVSEGDYPKGIDRLTRAAAILGPSSPAAADLDWAQALRKHHKSRKEPAAAPQVWVVFENGQSATYHAMRLVLPMVTGMPMTLALPVLAQNGLACADIQVSGGGLSVSTAPAGSFDDVMASEFSHRQPIIVADSVAEVLLKNAASVAAQKSNNVYLELAVTVGANISTTDTRSWTALPKEFQVARLAAPADGKISLQTADGHSLGNVQVPTDRPSIIYVKMQSAGGTPGVQMFPL